MKIPAIFSSSVNPDQLSLTVKGFILAVLPTVITVAGLAHLNLGQQEITGLANGLISVVSILAQLASAVMIVYGVARKMFVDVGVIKPATSTSTTTPAA